MWKIVGFCAKGPIDGGRPTVTIWDVPDREVAARLAAFRREGVDLERRLRGDLVSAPESEEYWRSQIGSWRGLIERTLTNYPIQLRAISQVPSGRDGPGWESRTLEEILAVRAKLDATIERLEGDG